MGYGYAFDGPPNVASGYCRPGTRALQDHLVATFGLADCGTYEDKHVGGNPHAPLSFHADGRAGDICGYPDPHRAAADWLVENAEPLGVQEVIYDSQIWRSTYREWHDFPGEDPHTSHVHWAQCLAAANTSAEQMAEIIEGITDMGLSADDKIWLTAEIERIVDGVVVTRIGKVAPKAGTAKTVYEAARQAIRDTPPKKA